MGVDIGKVIRFSFTEWLSNGALLKMFILLAIIYAVCTVAWLYAYHWVATKLISLIPTFDGSSLGIATSIQTINASMQLISMIFTLIAIAIPVGIVLWFVFSAIEYQVVAKSLNMRKIKTAKISFMNVLRLMALEILIFLYSVLSIFNLKALGLGILGLVLIVLSPLALFANVIIFVIFLIVGIVLLAYYAIMVIRSLIRLMPCVAEFVTTDESIFVALKQTWKLTDGNAKDIFFTVFISGIIIGIINIICSLPSTSYLMSIIIQKAIKLGSVNGFASMYGSSTALASKDLFLAQINVLVDPIYIALMIPVIIITTYWFVVSSAMISGIYLSIKKQL